MVKELVLRLTYLQMAAPEPASSVKGWMFSAGLAQPQSRLGLLTSLQMSTVLTGWDGPRPVREVREDLGDARRSFH